MGKHKSYYENKEESTPFISETLDDLDFEEAEIMDEEAYNNTEDFSEEEAPKEIIRTKESGEFDDSIKYYLEEISKYKLLNASEEQELSKRIQSGDELALEKLIHSNLRLVVKIAKHYTSHEYPLIDVIQDGNLGLMKAAEKFDYRKKVRFSTYASWWIKQTIVRSLSVRRRIIRIPHRKEEKLRKIQKAFNTFYQKNKRYANNEELSEILGLTVNEVDDILMYNSSVVSYENSLKEDSYSIKNILSDNSFKPDDLLEKDQLKNETEDVLDNLYPKEQVILKHRFGFDQAEKYTLKAMGILFGISAETVRQIEIKALKKIRISYPHLKDYICDN